VSFWGRFRKKQRVDSYELLRERLRKFRDLLEKNNRVLELMADAGEKLGGEYIFDIQYLRKLADDLEDALQSIVFDLNAVTENRYPELLGIVRSIESDLRAIMESRVVVRQTDLVVPLDRVELQRADVLGAKMARLGDIRRRLGLQIPNGFVVSAFACQLVLEEARIDPLIATMFGQSGAVDDSQLGGNAAKLSELVQAARLPKQLERDIRKATSRLARSCPGATFALRSSALGEDGDLSFAGQYRTLLGVGPADVVSAYKKVLASLFSPHVMAYRRSRGRHPARGLMSVGCLCMVGARAAGVLYSLDPSEPKEERMVVGAVRGLGITLVEGTGEADRYLIARRPPHEIVSSTIARKEEMVVVQPGSGVRRVPVPEPEQTRPALDGTELRALAEMALRIEKYLKCAQDIEWAIDAGGRIFILQARPLRLEPSKSVEVHRVDEIAASHPVLLKNRGTVACRGISAGRVHVVTEDDTLDNLPRGVVLVARTSTPRVAGVMAGAAAVITDIGTSTGHLGAIAREFRVPAIVDAQVATQVLREGEEVTVDAEENIVYQGKVDSLLHYQLLRSSTYEESFEFQLLQRMLRKIAPLHLIDPQSPDFSPARCETCHDIVRFAHEKAVERLTEGLRTGPPGRNPYVRRLDLDIPLDLILVDLGDGLETEEGAIRAKLRDVKSAPLCALLEGLTAEGVWVTGPADMDLDGFMSSMTRPGPVTPEPENNLAIISRRYVNLSLHLGYHFNIVDCYLTDTRNDNYIYFRFAGGVTEVARRSRRAVFLKRVLEKYDFVLEGRGDLVIGRIKKIAADAVVDRLKMVGRLIGFSRQLDILLRDDSLVDRCVNDFMAGRTVPLADDRLAAPEGRK
jgi:pyruvate,water dikinase